MATLYPIEVDVKVRITGDDGRNGEMTIGTGLHRIPTHLDMATYLETAQENMPDGFRLMTRHESETYSIRAKVGHCPPFALSNLMSGDEWHDPETANVHMAFSQDDEFEYEDEE